RAALHRQARRRGGPGGLRRGQLLALPLHDHGARHQATRATRPAAAGRGARPDAAAAAATGRPRRPALDLGLLSQDPWLRGSPWQRLYFLPEPHGHGAFRDGPPVLTWPVSGSTVPLVVTPPSALGAEYCS